MRIRRRSDRRLVGWVCGLAALSALGCKQTADPTAAKPQAARAEQSLERASAIKEGRGTPAVAVRWENKGSFQGSTLRATLENTTDRPVGVTLKLTSSGPHGRLADGLAGRHTIEPQTSKTVGVPVSKLPIQSAGAASAVTLVASYQLPRLEGIELPEGMTRPDSAIKAFSKSRRVRFADASFRTAFVDSTDEQSEMKADDGRGVSGRDVRVQFAKNARRHAVEGASSGEAKPVRHVGTLPGRQDIAPSTSDK